MVSTATLKRFAVTTAGCALAAIAGEVNPAQAAQVKYTYDGFSLNPSVVAPNVTASQLNTTFPSLIASGIGNPEPSGGPVVFSQSTLSFTVTPNAGYLLNLSSFSFDERNIGSFGPTSFSVFTSVDNFLNPIGSANLDPDAPSFTNRAFSLAAPIYQNLVSPFTIRIVADKNPPSTIATVWYTDNLTLDLEAVPVPTPALLPGLVGMGIAALRKKKQEEAVEQEA
jgi:hypothetical protein